MRKTTAAGVDVARSFDHTGVVLISPDGLVSGVHRLPTRLQWAEIADRVDGLIRQAGVAAIDATGCGDPFTSMLTFPGDLRPFRFTERSKADLFMGLVAAVQARDIRLDRGVPGTDLLVDELSRFTATPTRRGWRFSGKATGKDDLICALALAVWARGAG